MKRYEVADENFHITANLVLKLASRAREIFESSEVDEKRQLLNLVFQNLQLRGANLSVSVQEPFLTMIGYKECPTNWRWRDAFRTFSWRGFPISATLFSKKLNSKEVGYV
ncbi:MAG: hypothetical protein K2X08_06710 [Chlamydiales bacterium]|nr:hypothetical protein [Chlamydiales bacterium]